MAVSSLADALAEGGDVFATDNDPEFVAAAMPFALKAVEALVAESPGNEQLLLVACRGFTQYAYAFLDSEADRLEPSDYDAAEHLRERALKLYLRGRDYGLRGLELRYPGIGEALRRQPFDAVEDLPADAVELLYWTGAAWGAAISLGMDQPALAADVDAARALLTRALALQEDFQQGVVHEAMITLEALPAIMGGSLERARGHFQRALELSEGKRAGPYITMAEQVSVAEQSRAEFEELLNRALALDVDAYPDLRLENTLAQNRARMLLERVDDFFFENGPPPEE
jgi:predicted anti-sigma-YlaC factor YlaD